MHALLASYPPSGLFAADFDGSNDFLARGAGLTGAADSKSGIFSVWMRIDGGDGALRGIFNNVTTLGGGTGRCNAIMTGTNQFRIFAQNAAGTDIMRLFATTARTAGATWLHFLTSWDLAAAAGHLYTNDADDRDAGTTLLTNDTIDYTVADSGVGALPDGTAKLNSCLAELYFAPGQYLDFSVEANRRKFITAGGKPAYLGESGILPTGTKPLVYLRLRNEPVARFATNRGTGGGYTITGTLTVASSSPSA